MKLFAPAYYNKFLCIADKCKHSCCIGWEIDVDGVTLEKYRNLQCAYGETVKESVNFADEPHFKLTKGDRCPHLNENGLCRIILELGEDMLCDICREHPRFYNRTATCMEVGLGLSCEEACRIVLSSDDYSDFVCLGEVDGESDEDVIDTQELRSIIYSALANRSVPFRERLKAIETIFGVDIGSVPREEIHSLIGSLEYLSPDHKSLFSSYTNTESLPNKYEDQLERAFAYFVFRHCSEARCDEEYRISLCLCLFLVNLLACIICTDTLPPEECARIISEEIEYSEDNTEAIKDMFRTIFCESY